MKTVAIIVLAFCFCACLREELPKPESNTPPQITDERSLKIMKFRDSVVPFFTPMGTPEKYDWLASFKESGQTFEEYISGNPTLPTAERRTIYIQPIGEFTASQKRILNLTAEYMKAFYSLPVKLNSVTEIGNVPENLYRKNQSDGVKQIRTTYFLDTVLPKLLPENAAAFICFTNYDLYPDDNWNFVFGQASLQNRVGVWSLSRLGEPDKSTKDYQRFLARTLKIAMHETGHMFSMLHCTKYECLMSGTNGLMETDRRPMDVCPECMAKIVWAMNYEPQKRYENLAEFWKKQGNSDEYETFVKKAKAVSTINNEISK